MNKKLRMITIKISEEDLAVIDTKANEMGITRSAYMRNAAIAKARSEADFFSDPEALDAIARLLSGQEWSSDTASQVAEIVSATGRTITEPNEDIP